MSRWKALSGSLDPHARRLVVELRALKDRSGLSLDALAARTGTSKSSWARYLNGRGLPSRHAVERFARATGAAAPSQLLALWELAAASAPGAGEPVAARAGPGGLAAGSPAATGNDTRWPLWRRWRLGVTAALLVALAAGLLALSAVRPWDSGAGQAASAPSGTPTPVPSTTGASPVTYPCQFYEYEGLDYAGHSTTLTTEFGLGSNGEPIAEVQCLVKRHGFDPGAIDGIFGPNTEAAVIAFQRDQGLAGDGIVGPQTWRALRGG